MKQLCFYIAIISLLISTISCKTKKETTKSSTQTESSNANTHTYRLIVSFISKGTGVDRAKVEALLKQVESNSNKLVYEKVQWGREGETDFCFQLGNLKKTEQITFINEIKKQMTGSDMVFITENAPCTHIRK